MTVTVVSQSCLEGGTGLALTGFCKSFLRIFKSNTQGVLTVQFCLISETFIVNIVEIPSGCNY